MMQLYWSPRSRSFSALWLMEETGQPYERVLIDIATGAQRKPEYLAINPMGKVPALRHGDVIITEVAAICTYLADAFPEKKLNVPARPQVPSLRSPSVALGACATSSISAIPCRSHSSFMRSAAAA